MSKQVGIAVVLILLGFGLTTLEESAFYIGLGYGIVAMGSLWLVIMLIKDLKKKDNKKDLEENKK